MATRKERICLQYLDFSLFPFDLPWTLPPGWCLLYSGLLFAHARVRAHIHTQDMPHQPPQRLSMHSSWQSGSATTYMYICDCLEFSQGVKPWADAFTKHSYCLLILGQHHVQADGLTETVCHQHGYTPLEVYSLGNAYTVYRSPANENAVSDAHAPWLKESRELIGAKPLSGSADPLLCEHGP